MTMNDDDDDVYDNVTPNI